jgi:hypothetical protein
MVMWKIGADIVRDHPLLGVGLCLSRSLPRLSQKYPMP